MSKSKGEFLTVSLLESKGYNPLAYRFFCLGSHYRKPLTFSYEALDQAQAGYNKLLKRIDALNPNTEVDAEFVNATHDKFLSVVGNDLNTALGITAIYDILKADTTDASKLEALKDIDKVLSLNLVREKKAQEVSEKSEFELQIEDLIAQRAQAKKDKDFARADEIRDELARDNITTKDMPEGPVWQYIK
jgi:cysteinyl-tRNA synthetase